MSKDNIHEFTLRREIWKYFLSRRMQLAVSLKYLIRRGRGCTSHNVCMLLVHLKSFQRTIGLKEICDGRRLCPKILYMSSLSERKSGNISSLDKCS